MIDTGRPGARYSPIRGWSSGVNIGLAVTRCVVDHFGEGAVPLPQDRRRRQRVGDLGGGVRGEPLGEQSGQRVAVPVPLALVGEVGVERLGKCGNGLRRSGEFGQVAEVAAR